MPHPRLIEPAKPFVIGLKPLEAELMLLVDEELDTYRREKQLLYQTEPGQVIAAEADTLDAQSEVLQLVTDNLKAHHGDLYEFDGQLAHVHSTGETIDLSENCPIAQAALLVQDDLVLMRRDDNGWRLVAASLCFPSNWSLAEKFGKPMGEIHGPVPISDQMHQRIHRIFDGLRVEIPVWRANWSLEDSQKLRLDRTFDEKVHTIYNEPDQAFLRTEYQTLHKLPVSHDILFTIRIAVHPMGTLGKPPGGKQRMDELLTQFKQLSAAQRRYKGLAENGRKFELWSRILEDMEHGRYIA